MVENEDKKSYAVLIQNDKMHGCVLSFLLFTKHKIGVKLSLNGEISVGESDQW